MTEGSRSFLEMWLQMSIPESEESLSIRRVRGAENVLLSKDSEGTFGIVMHGVTDDFRNPRLANLSFSSRPPPAPPPPVLSWARHLVWPVYFHGLR